MYFNLRTVLVATVSIVLMATLVGCSEPTLDSDNMDASMQEVRESLPAEQEEEFEEAWGLVAMEAMGGSLNVDGMTATDVIDRAEEIRAEREREAREEAHQEIRELREQREAAMEAREKLEAFEVERSRYYMQERRFGGDQPIVEMTVTNGTDHAVSRAYFEGVVTVPDREVPFIDESFNYGISGGIEPGETQTWELAPNQFSEWGTVDYRDDMVLTVETTRIDDANEDPLFEADWGEREEERLQTLVSEYGDPDA
jgi:hypothetical protein